MAFGEFFLQITQVLVCLVIGGGELRRLWDPVPKKSYQYSGPSPTRPSKLWTRPDMEPLVVNGVSCWVSLKRKTRG